MPASFGTGAAVELPTRPCCNARHAMTWPAGTRRNGTVGHAAPAGLNVPLRSFPEAIWDIATELAAEFHAATTSSGRRAEIVERFALLHAVLSENGRHAALLGAIEALLGEDSPRWLTPNAQQASSPHH